MIAECGLRIERFKQVANTLVTETVKCYPISLRRKLVMAVELNINEVAAQAWQRYAEIKQPLEAEHFGKFLVIEVKSGDYFIDEDDMQAIKKAKAAYPRGTFYLIRIGYKAAHTLK